MSQNSAPIAAFAGGYGEPRTAIDVRSAVQESNVVAVMSPVSARGSAGSGAGDNIDLLVATSLPEWVLRALADNGVVRVSEVSAMSDDELLRLRGVGQRSVKLIRSTILSHRRRRKLGLLD